MDLSLLYPCVCTSLIPPAPGLIGIYGLYDQRDGEIRYVGKSIAPARRLIGHRTYLAGNDHKTRWIAQLRAAGYEPHMLILAWVTPQEWQAAEAHFIALLRGVGCRLTNFAPGGNETSGMRGRHHTVEAKAKLSLANRLNPGKKRSPQYREAARARTIEQFSDPQARAHAAEKSRGRPHTAEEKAKIGAALRGRKRAPEAVAMTAAKKRGQTLSPAQRDHIAAKTREAMQRPAVKAKCLKGSRGRVRRAESRAKASATMTTLWRDPQFREKMRAASRRKTAGDQPTAHQLPLF